MALPFFSLGIHPQAVLKQQHWGAGDGLDYASLNIITLIINLLFLCIFFEDVDVRKFKFLQ